MLLFGDKFRPMVPVLAGLVWCITTTCTQQLPVRPSANVETLRQPTADETEETNWRRHLSPVAADLHKGFFYGHHGWIIAHRSGQVLYSADAGQTWSLQAELGEGYLEAVQFVDDQHGFICGDKGAFYATANGGTSWQRAALDDNWILSGMHFFDHRRGIVLGTATFQDSGERQRKPIVLHTSDGGKLFEPLADPPGAFYSDAVEFVDEREGYIGGLRFILNTVDGGEHWQPFDLGQRVMIRAIHFSSGVGWAVGHDGVLLRSTNRGSSWEQLPMFTDNRLRSVVFIDSQRGFISGDQNKSTGVIWQTVDGGRSWERQPVEAPDIHQLLLSDQRLFAIGKQGTIVSVAIPGR